MSDTAINKITQYGTQAERIAFTPTPPAGIQTLYLWYETDNEPDLYAWNGATWEQVNASAGGITELTGEVTAGPGSGSQAATIANDAVVTAKILDSNVTLAKIANIADASILGNDAGAPAAPQALNANEVSDILDTATDPFVRTSAVSSGITELTGDVTAGPGSGAQAAALASQFKTRAITIVIDGGGAVITTGIKGDIRIPVACVILGVRMLADQAGAIVVDIWKDTYANYPPTDADSITAAAPPTIAATNDKSEDTTLTGWTTNIAAGDILRFNVDSVATIERVTLAIDVQVS